MSVTPPRDHPPGRDAPYGEMLTYWMNRLGMSNGDLAQRVSVHRTYPGHIKSGRRTPHPDTANNIRKHMLEAAQQPGPYARPRLTDPEQRYMDDLLRTSFERADRLRGQRKQHIDDALAADDVTEDWFPHDYDANDQQGQPGSEPRPEVESPTDCAPAELLASEVGLPVPILPGQPVVAPQLPGVPELEAFIAMYRDQPSADEDVRNIVKRARLLALGRPDELGLAHLLHCTVPIGKRVVAILPVFTRPEYVAIALEINPSWREEIQVLQVEIEGEVLLADLDPHEVLGINLWSGHQFQLPAERALSRAWANLKREWRRGLSAGGQP